eukprot:1350910-Amorphochlora_amoeboformis.AAC.3
MHLDEVKKLKEGDTWCFVSKKWFARWINYSQCESFWEVKPDSKAEVVSPGEIDNSPLLMEVKGKYPVTEIRRDLQEIRDYFTIPEAVYDLLQKWHKGGVFLLYCPSSLYTLQMLVRTQDIQDSPLANY